MDDAAPILDPQHLVANEVREHLRDAARTAASWNVVHRPNTRGTFQVRIRAAQNALKRLQTDLASSPIADAATGSSALLAVRENLRLLRSAINDVSDSRRLVARLPRIIRNAQPEKLRAAAVAAIYLHAVEEDFSPPTFQAFINELQTHDALVVEELWSIAGFLKFALLEAILVEASKLLRSAELLQRPLISVSIRSLRSISTSDWVSIIEPLISFDAALRQDPAEAYGSMTFESRELYRRRVAFIARHSDFTESQVAQAALDLAREGAQHPSDERRIHRRRMHVGYYLIDKGLPILALRTGFHPPVIDRVRGFIRAKADDFYIVGIELVTIFLVAATLFPLLPRYPVGALVIALALVLLPVSQDAVELVNSAVTTIFSPQPLPKLDFSKGFPPECATMVVVPALLLNEREVRKLVADLEVRFLGNRDPHLHFALLTDLPDSIAKPRANDSDPLVELAIQLINELNARYASPQCGAFLLLHRHRIFNTRQGVWMGWERKRGKLLDLNNFLVGDYDAFPIKSGRLEVLGQVRYILTLDADTQLPRDAAAQLVGAIAHPLNQAVIDPKLRIVTAGYGILQPRVGITVHSASRSRLATLYSGQTGFDIYTRAVSDAYQDLFSEGSFTGKGIYEVAVFHSVLNHRFPRNALLSHDLIEGAYTRAGLVADVEVIDDYPSHYSAYTRRKHRWVRGDWQIAQWMFSRVPEESGNWVHNPISLISRWKIFDNLRRSLVEPFTFILIVAGWLGLPGGPLYWTVAVLLMLMFPALAVLGFGLGSAFASDQKGDISEAFNSFWKAILVAFLNLVFLPHQTLLAIDAIVRALVRRLITGQRLLEWETAAQAESLNSFRTPVDRYLELTPFVAIALGMLVFLFAPQKYAILFATPILVLWALAYLATAWLNRSPREVRRLLGTGEDAFLLTHALRAWRYFNEFASERHHYLIPDNVEENGLQQASRVSPTNLGLLLNARQAAYELGFLTAPEFALLTDRTLSTVEKLENYRGHLYNWYETDSLAPLPPHTVSSVDSGNLVASLYTLRAGTITLGRQPLLGRHLFTGLRAHWRLMQFEKATPAPLAQFSPPSPAATAAEWIAWLPNADAALAAATAAPIAGAGNQWWLEETRHRVSAILVLLRDYQPWLLPEYASLRKLPELDLKQTGDSLSIESAAVLSELLDARLARALATLESDSPLLELARQLRAALPDAARNLRDLAAALRTIAHRAETLAKETDFSFLVHPYRQMLSIGYDVAAQQLHEACYDLLASEARIATFLAIARGDLRQQSWMKLGRDHTRAFGRFLLLSWTGTMFEYLMPALWMRSFPDTFIARSLTTCVQAQRAFARSLKIPWGISESGFANKDDAGHYQYQAFGIPEAAISFNATAGPVVSPYSTFLALSVDTPLALRNLHRMADAGWVGAYGFYEAADYSSSPKNPVLVREWMAHHQGMSLLAILNLLRDNIVQHWFHSNPLVRSTELLLNELPARNAVLRMKTKELASARHGIGGTQRRVNRARTAK